MREARAQEPALNRLDGDRLADLLDRVAERAPALQRANADVVTARLRARFAESVAHSQRSVTGMSTEDRALKAVWMAGRRELEHEFGKVRAYKSIRAPRVRRARRGRRGDAAGLADEPVVAVGHPAAGRRRSTS